MYLDTGRLIIRNYQENDVNDLYEVFGDSKVMKYCEPIYSLEKTRNFIKELGLKTNPRVFGIEEKLSQKLIGHALFGQSSICDQGIYEIGWILNKNYCVKAMLTKWLPH